MSSNYLPLLVILIVTTVLAFGMACGSFLLGPKKPTLYKSSTYECGMTPVGTARERFPIKFYLIAMLFIVFDIETIFLYPWAVTYARQGFGMKAFYFGEMAVFVAILFIGYFYILGKGALDWDEAEAAPRNPDVITPEVKAPRAALRFGNEHSGEVDLNKTPTHRPLPAYGASSQEQYQRIPVTQAGKQDAPRRLPR